ncbi:uncharacterized protein LOC112571684 isoform X1 [Pomacea canaliculata]|uniref:uncharacterized protein LOC112571684 isoform X1 n=1 Tax=Pomacea canaliculata TaxID=400727 RepID=UPI000D72AED6|nr:uncharacterized protein LOC112571684 isoform X1 [Pomacea canaliculata]
MVVDALYNVHYMLLSVMVEDQVTRVKRFLRVRTKKTSTLAASLENELPGLSCYTIAGPRNGISFQTIAEELQGKQLTLKRHIDPQEDSVEQIYGTPLISRPLTQPSTRNNQTTVTTAVTSTTTASSPTSSNTQTTTSQMVFNILPTERISGPKKQQGSAQPTISVTFPKVPFSSTVQLDMNMPEGVQWVNNLSRQDSPGRGNGIANHRPCSPCRPPQDVAMATTCNNLMRMSPAVDHRNAGLTCNNLQCMLPAGKLENTGTVCNTLQCTPPVGDGECGKKLKIDNLGLTARDFTQHSLMSFQEMNFPLLTMDTRDSNDIYPEEAPAPCQRQQSMGSLNPIELTVPKELSLSDSLEGWTPVKQPHEKVEDERKVFPDGMRQHPRGMDNILSPEHGHGRHGLLNNLFSSTFAKCVTTSQSDYIPHDHPLVFQNRRPCSPLFTSGGLPAATSKIEPMFEKSNIKLPGKSSPLFQRKVVECNRSLNKVQRAWLLFFMMSRQLIMFHTISSRISQR